MENNSGFYKQGSPEHQKALEIIRAEQERKRVAAELLLLARHKAEEAAALARLKEMQEKRDNSSSTKPR